MRKINPFRRWPILRSVSTGGDWKSLGFNRPVTPAVYHLRRRLAALRQSKT